MRKIIQRWLDGDTARCTDGTIVRLAQVRAPEHYQYGGIKATSVAAGMTGRSRGIVTVIPVSRSYDRSVVEMRNREGSINKRMMRKGYWNKGR